MKQKLLAVLVLAAVLLAGCGARGPEYITVGEETYPADIQQLDLRDKTITAVEYEQLRAALPGCEILWNLSFQGLSLPMDTQELEVNALTTEGLDDLCYLQNLNRITIGTCPEMDVLAALNAVLPDCEVRYNVTIGSQTLPMDITAAELSAGELGEALERIAYLPALTEVTVTDTVTDLEAMVAVKEAYPEVSFRFTFLLFDAELSSDAAEVDLSGIEMESVDAVEAALPLFSGLERLILCDTGLPSEELDH